MRWLLTALSCLLAVPDSAVGQTDEERYAAQLQQLVLEDGGIMTSLQHIYEGGILNKANRTEDLAVLAKIPGLSGTDGDAAMKTYVACCDECVSPASGTAKCDGCAVLSAESESDSTCTDCGKCADACFEGLPEGTQGLYTYYKEERAEDVEVEEDQKDDDHPWWQTTLLIVGFLCFMGLGLWLYWRTSDMYKIRKQQILLGYEVPEMISYVSWCCVCCIGPMVRRKWERNNKYFRTDDYGDETQPWLGKYLNPKRGKWGKLPRGDAKAVKQTTQEVLVKVQAKVMNDLFVSAIKRALEHYERDAKRNAAAREGMEKQRRYTQAHNFMEGDIERMHQEELTQFEAEAAVNLDEADSGDSEESGGEWGGVMETGFGPGGPTAHRVAATATAAAVVERGSAVSFALPPSSAQGGGAWDGASDWGRPEDAVAPTRTTHLSLVRLRKKTREMTPENITAEFKQIPNKPYPVSKLPAEAKMYTRNLKFVPLPGSAVKVNPKENEANTRYINASYVPGPSGEPKRYIVTQAPQSGRHSSQGKGKTIDAFWSMVFAHRCNVIVMIEGSQPYIPEEVGDTAMFHKIKVIARKVERRTHWTMTTVELQHSRVAGSSRIVHHFNFTGWPRAAAAPSSSAPLMQLMDQVMQKVEENPDAPIVVQDLCGGGKAGTYIAIEYAMQALDESGSSNPASTAVDVAGIVAQLREVRPGLVTFPAEYVFVHKVVTMYSLELEVPAPPAYAPAPPD